MRKIHVGLSIAELALFLVLVAQCRGQSSTNIPPTVSIVSPIDGAVASTSNALFITVQATDVDGTVAEVDLYQNGQLVATSDSSPYEFELVNLTAGTNIYTASATDTQGEIGYSDPVTIFELSQPPSYYAPEISFIFPETNAIIIGPTNLTLSVQVTDRGYPVVAVDFAENGMDLGIVTNAPFSWTVTNIPVGKYNFSAIVTDAGGYYMSTDPLPVTIIPNPATTPLVSIDSPTNGVDVLVGQPTPLTVSETSNGASIDRVDFYVNNEVIGSVTNPPYSLSWKPSQLGQACWSAGAVYNNQSGTNFSQTACINVELPPTGHTRYAVVDLGVLATDPSSGFGLNGLGQIVGYEQVTPNTSGPFLYSGGIVTVFTSSTLTTGTATGINNAGQIVVNAFGYGYIVQDGQITNIGSLGGSPTYVRAINSSGLAIGDSIRGDGNDHAFLYNGQSMIDLGPSTGTYKSQAYAINDFGMVVGWSQNSSGQYAFVYDSSNGMQVVPTPTGTSVGEAFGINNLSNIVGDAYYGETGIRHAFINLNGVPQDLGSLGNQTSTSSANGINNSNQVVGYSQVPTGDNRGFLWETNVLFDLNLLIPTNSDWSITGGIAINDAGQILCSGLYGTKDRNEHVVLLNPVSSLAGPPPTVTIATPTNDSVIAAGIDVSITVAAADQSGYVTEVSFYAGSQLLGSATTPPFDLTWTNAPPGTYQLTAVATDNFGDSETSAPVTLTIQSPNPAAPRVAILSAATPADNADIQNKLINTIFFNSVDIISITATDAVPTLAQLLNYDSLLIYSFQPFNNPVAIGNLLADFEDQGRGVVLGLFALDTSKTPLGGRFVSQNYLPWSESADNFDNFGDPFVLGTTNQSPLLAGVTSFNGGTLSYYQANPVLSPGTELVASWNNGQPLVATRQVGIGNVVGLNFFPVSSDVYSGWWDSGTDGAKLIANALNWTAQPPSEVATLTVSSNILNYIPGQNISFAVNLTDYAAPPAQVDLYTNNSLFVTLSQPPYTFTWTNPPLGNYLAAAIVTDSQSNTIASSPLALSVDSRLTVNLLTPTNGAVIIYPSTIPFTVAATDFDAAIVSVNYYLNGTQFIGQSTHAPFSLSINPGTVGTFPITAVATDALGAQQTSQANVISVIQSNPNKPIQTSWVAVAGDWLGATNWSDGIPRAQDTALIDNGGTTSLNLGSGVVSNLTVGLNSNGIVVVGSNNLSLTGTLTLGQNIGSSGDFEMDGPGNFRVSQMFLGSGGNGHFAQYGGTNTVAQYMQMAANSGGQSLYELFGGELNCFSEYVEGEPSAQFNQTGGVNIVLGLVVGGSQPSINGAYNLQGGTLHVGDESINTPYPNFASFVQTGGTHQVTNLLSIGDQAQGELVFSGGTLIVNQFTMGLGGLLDVTVGGQTNGIQVTGKAILASRLILHLAPAYLPQFGDTWPILTYGSYFGTFSSITLPPATNGVTWETTYTSNQLVLQAMNPPVIVVASTPAPGAQSNLYSETIVITNSGTLPFSGARIFFPALPSGVEVYNASGTQAGVPYVQYDDALAPGQSVQLTIQFLARITSFIATPEMVFGSAITNRDSPPPGAPLELGPPSRMANGNLTLQFNITPNSTNYVQYSADLTNWQTVNIPIIGVGNQLQWTDDGPPKTQSLPQSQTQRFYRIIRSP